MLIDLSLFASDRPSRRFKPQLEALENRDVPALFVTKTVDKPTVEVGSSVTYTITVVNTGTLRVDNVFATDSLPPGLTPTGGNAPLGASVIGQGVIADIGSLEPGELATVLVFARADAAGTFVNFATAAGFSDVFEAGFATPVPILSLQNLPLPQPDDTTPDPETGPDTPADPGTTSPPPATPAPSPVPAAGQTGLDEPQGKRELRRQLKLHRQTVRRRDRLRARVKVGANAFRTPGAGMVRG